MLYVISGCSGGGKSTLIDALAARGFGISQEPGRQIVREELDTGGDALPWVDPVAFSEKCADLSVHRYSDATEAGTVVFFDRSLIDAVSSLIYEQPDSAKTHLLRLQQCRYANTVFIAPPWPELFENDPERQHSFADAVAEYDRLLVTYRMAGYSVLILPKSPLADRIDFVLKHIENEQIASFH
ncbi:MAG: AAA family ATPase [Granulosicoccus sp.]